MSIIENPRNYQQEGLDDAFKAWSSGVKNVCLVAPTGAGKTIIKGFAAKYFLTQQMYPVSDPTKFVVVFAHRDVLLEQISLAMAKIGLVHQLLCSASTSREIGDIHMRELGRSYVDGHFKSRVIVASVPTWVKRDTSHINDKVGLWLMDETHHLLADNQWGRAIEPLTNAIGLGVTATPLRADRKGLGAHADGVFEAMVECPDMGELIKRGALSPYRIYHVPDRVDMSDVNVTSGGDYNRDKLAKATDNPDITGDAVAQYRKVANNKQTIIFAVNIEHSNHVAEQFKNAGYSAISLSSKTNIRQRQRYIQQFKNRQIQILVNCDLFGEGFDVPAVEVVIMLRKTKSYGLFMQMFGRMLRPFDGKPYGILIDHVGNLREHCNTRRPHESPQWTLDRPVGRKKKNDDEEEALFTRTCPECACYYEPASKLPDDFICPDCGHKETQAERNEQQRELIIADGELVEYDTSFLDEIINQRKKIDRDVTTVAQGLSYSNANSMVIASATKRHLARQEAQRVLRGWVNSWCSNVQTQYGYDVDVTRAEFKRVFGTHPFEAALLSANEATALTQKIQSKWSDHITTVNAV